MNFLLAFFSLAPLLAFVPSTLANTEKVIFVAPPTDTLSEIYDWSEATPQTLTPANRKLRTSLPVAFPTTERPKGLDSWYRLADLEEGARYEVRVCWAAVQPTSFTLDVFGTGQDAGTILLLQSAADFFTTNATLMQSPLPVDVDIILDPYVANIFPQSLLPTAAYIVVLAVIGVLISGVLWQLVAPPTTPATTKRHTD